MLPRARRRAANGVAAGGRREAAGVGVSTACARTLVDEGARAGLTDAAEAPGSRSAPLALALADDDRSRVHVHPHERPAAFFPPGAARTPGPPVGLPRP